MKITTILNYSLTAFLLVGCAQIKASDKKKKIAKAQTRDLSETVNLDDEPLIKVKKGAENHELADADADEEVIQREVGSTEIDTDLPDSDKDTVPYSRDFLMKKNTKRMQFWVDYFTKQQRERFQRFINNGEEYRHHIEEIFAQHGLPKELYFVGLIESGYYLGARSHAAAVGPWQFIKGTAKRYGLKVTSELDERQDLFKATTAAAMYFRDMHNVLASWELALAGYNAGENGIIRRIMRHGTRDFYELSRRKQLPSETINYVPKVLAAMHVINNAKKYGFSIPKKKYRIFDRTVLTPVQKNTSLQSLARRFNVDVHLLKKLNPELKRNMTPRYFTGSYQLRVPRGNYAPSTIAETKDQTILPQVETHQTVKRPKKRIEITRRTASISKKLPARIVSNKNIKIMNRPIVYKVKRGDNLTNLARVFNVKLSKLKKANKIRRNSGILVGQKIVLPDSQKAIYTVKKGDHLTKVARKLNQPLEALIKLNALKRNTIYPGQKIIVNMD